MVTDTSFLNNVLSEVPFKDRLFIGDYLTGVKNVVTELGGGADSDKKVLVKIVATEQSYLSTAKALRESLKDSAQVEAFALNTMDGLDVIDLSPTHLIIGVGNVDFLNRLLLATQSIQAVKLAVPDSGVFAQLFCARKCFVPVKGAESTLGLYDNVVLDINLYKRLKKNHIADAFSYIGAKKLQLFELKLNGCDEQNLRLVEGLVESATGLLKGVTEQNMYAVSIVAQLMLARAVYFVPELDLSPSYYCALVLSRLTGNTKEECLFALSNALITGYGAYAAHKSIVFDLPEVNKDVESACEILGVKSSKILPYLDVNDFDGLNRVKASLDLCEAEILTAKRTTVQLKAAYDKIYRGRKRRDGFEKDQLMQAITFGGLLSYGVLKAMYDDGFLKLLTDN